MAKVTSLIMLLVLTAAAVSIPAPAAGAGAGGPMPKGIAGYLEKWKKWIELAKDSFEEINKRWDGELLSRGKDAVARLLPDAVTVDVVQAGGVNFSVAGVDIISPVTWTSRCGGGGSSQQVACGDPLCEQYGACDGGDASSSSGRVCNSVAPAGVPLHEGKIALLDAKSKGIFSKDNAAYACRPNAAARGGNDYAVIGLGFGRANVTAAFQHFSYIIDGDLQGSTVWLKHNVLLAQRATAAQAGSRSTTRLRTVRYSSRIYYVVGITGIKVGSGGVGSEEVTADGILMTTMPITFIKPSLFDHLKQELNKAVASPAVNGSSIDAKFQQLCYPSGTKLPAITLLFDGQNAGMELQPEHYSYAESTGVVCLSILPSPWSSDLSVIGSMVQAGRRMTYNLDDGTLTFDASASSVAQAALTPFFLSPAFALLLLAIIIII